MVLRFFWIEIKSKSDKRKKKVGLDQTEKSSANEENYLQNKIVEISASHISDRRLIATICKEHILLIIATY